MADKSPENLVLERKVDDLAYIIGSSGFTGEPKLIKINHHGLMPFMRLHHPYMRLADNSLERNQLECMAVLMDINFDAHLAELLIPLTCGARARVLPADKVRMEFDLYRSWYKGVTMGIFTPSVMAILQDNVGELRENGLRVVLGTGEAMPEHIRKLWGENFLLINGWGPTEDTIGTYLMLYENKQLVAADTVEGRTVYLYKFDEDAWKTDRKTLLSKDNSALGEIYITGTGLSPGYVDSAQDEGRFVMIGGQRAFATGDLAQWERKDIPGGGVVYELKIRGRIDRQFKLHGMLVNASEIEAKLSEAGIKGIEFYVDQEQEPAQAPTGGGAAAAAVSTERRSVDDHKPLMVYVWHTEEATDKTIEDKTRANSIDYEFLSAYLESELTRYMVPAYWIYLTEPVGLSKGSWKKIGLNKQRDRLAELRRKSVPICLPGHIPFDEKTFDEKTELSVSKKICKAWREALGHRDEFDYRPCYDHEFRLAGGSSLAFSGLRTHLAELFGISLRYYEMIQDPTLGGLCRLVKRKVKNKSLDENAAGKQKEGAKPILPQLTEMVEATTQQDKPPLYLIHSLMGKADEDYQQIVHHWKHSKPFAVYAISAAGLNDQDAENDPEFMEDNLALLGDAYAQMIETMHAFLEKQKLIPSNSPYLLVGWSAGGVILLAVAQCLQKGRKRDVSVVMLDSAAPAFYRALGHKKYWEQFLHDLYEPRSGSGRNTTMHRLQNQFKAIFKDHCQDLSLHALAQSIYDDEARKRGKHYPAWVENMSTYPAKLQIYRFSEILIEFAKRYKPEVAATKISVVNKLIRQLKAIRATLLALLQGHFSSYPERVQLWRAEDPIPSMDGCGQWLGWEKQAPYPLRLTGPHRAVIPFEGNHFSMMKTNHELMAKAQHAFVEQQWLEILTKSIRQQLQARYQSRGFAAQATLANATDTPTRELQGLFTGNDPDAFRPRSKHLGKHCAMAWAQGELWAEQFYLVFYVSLRELDDLPVPDVLAESLPAHLIENLLLDKSDNRPLTPKNLNEAVKRLGKRVLWLIDEDLSTQPTGSKTWWKILRDTVNPIQAAPSESGRSRVLRFGQADKSYLNTTPAQIVNPAAHSINDHQVPNARNQYLQEVIAKTKHIDVLGLNLDQKVQLPLEKVYVGLKVDATPPSERAQFYKARNRLFRSKLYSLSFLPADLKNRLIRELKKLPDYDPEHPKQYDLNDFMSVLQFSELSLEDREAILLKLETCFVNIDKELNIKLGYCDTTTQKHRDLTFGEAYRQFKHLVILGHPGSGKTTLARWITLKMATALLMSPDDSELVVGLHEVDPHTKQRDSYNLGSIRLPILINIWSYANYRRTCHDERKNTLEYYICNEIYPTIKNLETLVKIFLNQGKALLIMDGLDEVPNLNDRDDVIQAVHDFLRQYGIREPIFFSVNEADDKTESDVNTTEIDLGNRIIITSRVAGNYTFGFNDSLIRVLIDDMTSEAIESFFHSWMKAVYQAEYRLGRHQNVDLDQLAANEAQALIRLVHKQVMSLNMARIPQLASVLAQVYYQQKSLPQSRAALYKTAIRHVMTSWLQGKRGMDTQVNLSEAMLFRIFEAIAYHMHQHTGPIHEEKLEQLVVMTLEAESYSHPVIATKQFMLVLKKDVGLLAAFGNAEYRFLHRTFQEYFAGRYMIRASEDIPKALIHKMDDPTWREVILMALGYLASEHSDQINSVIKQLLEYNRKNSPLIPNATFMLVAALTDMNLDETVNQQQHDHILDCIIQQLLSSYQNALMKDGLEELQKQIVFATSGLMRGTYQNVLHRKLLHIIKTMPYQRASVAALLHALGHYSNDHVRELGKHLCDDTRTSNWAIHQYLQSAMSAHLPEPPKLPEDLNNSLTIYQHLENFTAQNQSNSDNYAMSVKELYALNSNQTPLMQSFALRFFCYQKNLQIALTQTVTQIPSHLKLKRALSEDPGMVASLERHPILFAIVTALYGGYDNFCISQIIRRYLELSAHEELHIDDYLFSETCLRESGVISNSIEQAINGSRAQRILEQRYPQFSPAKIYRDTQLSAILKRQIQNPTTLEQLVKQIKSQFNRSVNLQDKTDVLIALVLLNQDITDMFTSKLKNALLVRLEALCESLQELVCRGAPKIEMLLGSALQVENKIYFPELLLRTILVVNVSSHALPINTLFPKLNTFSSSLRIYAVAEYMAAQLTRAVNINDVGQTTTVIGELQTLHLSATELINAWSLMGSSLQRGQPVPNHYLVLSTLSPDYENDGDIPFVILSSLVYLPRTHLFVLNWFLSEMQPVIKLEPQIKVEIDIIRLAISGNQAPTDQDDTEPTAKDWLTQLLQRAQNISSPYFQARALIRIARYFPEQWHELIASVWQKSQEIDKPQQRCQVLDALMIALMDPDVENNASAVKLSEVLALGISSARAITNPANRARALTRLVFTADNDKQEQLLQEALEAVLAITELKQRLQVFLAIKPLCSSFDRLDLQLSHVIHSFSDIVLKAQAEGEVSELLQFYEDGLRQLPTFSNHSWVPFMLMGKFVAFRTKYANETIETILLDLLKQPTRDNYKRLESKINGYFFPLTAGIVLLFSKLLENGHFDWVTKSLSCCFVTDVEVIVLLKRWLHYDNKALHASVYLLLCEVIGIITPAAKDIVALLESPCINLKNRADYLISGRSVYDQLHWLSSIGVETFEKLAQLSRETAQPSVRLNFNWLVGRLSYDLPEVIERWSQRAEILDAEGESEAARIMHSLLGQIVNPNEAMWQAMIKYLQSGSTKTKASLISSVARIEYRGRLSDTRKAQFLQIVGTLNNADFADYTYCKVSHLELVKKIIELFNPHYGQPPRLESMADNTLALKKFMSISYQELLELPQIDIIPTLNTIASYNFYVTGDCLNHLKEEVSFMKDEPELLPWLFAVMMDCAQKYDVDESSTSEFTFFSYMLELCATAAQLLPLTFGDMIINLKDNDPLTFTFTKSELIETLQITTTDFNSYPVRAAALALLGNVAQVDAETLQVINTALIDVPYVRHAAITAATQLHQIQENDFLQELIGSASNAAGLYNSNALVVNATALILCKLLKQPALIPDLRYSILSHLNQALDYYLQFPRRLRYNYLCFLQLLMPSMASMLCHTLLNTPMLRSERGHRQSLPLTKDTSTSDRVNTHIMNLIQSAERALVDDEFDTALHNYEQALNSVRNHLGGNHCMLKVLSFSFKNQILSHLDNLSNERKEKNEVRMSKFIVPCQFGSIKSPFTIYIGGSKKYNSLHPLFFQQQWLNETRGGNIPQEIMESIEKLLQLARKNTTNFRELTEYAFKDDEVPEKEKPAESLQTKERAELSLQKKDRDLKSYQHKFKLYQTAAIHDFPDLYFDQANESCQDDLALELLSRQRVLEISAAKQISIEQNIPGIDHLYNLVVTYDTSPADVEASLILTRHYISKALAGEIDNLYYLAFMLKFRNVNADNTTNQVVIECLQQLFMRKHAIASARLAEAYMLGILGVEKNELYTIYFFTMAAQYGSIEANRKIKRSKITDPRLVTSTSTYFSYPIYNASEFTKLISRAFQCCLRQDAPLSDLSVLAWALLNNDQESLIPYQKFPDIASEEILATLLMAVKTDNNRLFEKCIELATHAFKTPKFYPFLISQRKVTTPTPLYLAFLNQKKDIAITLMKHGADPINETYQGYSPVDAALFHHHAVLLNLTDLSGILSSSLLNKLEHWHRAIKCWQQGNVNFKEGNIELAINNYLDYKTIWPEGKLHCHNLFRCYLICNQIELIKPLYKLMRQVLDTLEFELEYIQFCYQQGQYYKVIALSTKALASLSDDRNSYQCFLSSEYSLFFEDPQHSPVRVQKVSVKVFLHRVIINSQLRVEPLSTYLILNGMVDLIRSQTNDNSSAENTAIIKNCFSEIMKTTLTVCDGKTSHKKKTPLCSAPYETLYHLAITYDMPLIIDYLLKNFPNELSYQANINGITPLMQACFQNKENLFQQLQTAEINYTMANNLSQQEVQDEINSAVNDYCKAVANDLDLTKGIALELILIPIFRNYDKLFVLERQSLLDIARSLIYPLSTYAAKKEENQLIVTELKKLLRRIALTLQCDESLFSTDGSNQRDAVHLENESSSITIPLAIDYYDSSLSIAKLLSLHTDDLDEFPENVTASIIEYLAKAIENVIKIYGKFPNTVLKLLRQAINPLFEPGEYHKKVYITLVESSKFEGNPSNNTLAESLMFIRRLFDKDPSIITEITDSHRDNFDALDENKIKPFASFIRKLVHDHVTTVLADIQETILTPPLQACLEGQKDLNCSNEQQMTPLMLACFKGDWPLYKRLRALGATFTPSGYEPIDVPTLLAIFKEKTRQLMQLAVNKQICDMDGLRSFIVPILKYRDFLVAQDDESWDEKNKEDLRTAVEAFVFRLAQLAQASQHGTLLALELYQMTRTIIGQLQANQPLQKLIAQCDFHISSCQLKLACENAWHRDLVETSKQGFSAMLRSTPSNARVMFQLGRVARIQVEYKLAVEHHIACLGVLESDSTQRFAPAVAILFGFDRYVQPDGETLNQFGIDIELKPLTLYLLVDSYIKLYIKQPSQCADQLTDPNLVEAKKYWQQLQKYANDEPNVLLDRLINRFTNLFGDPLSPSLNASVLVANAPKQVRQVAASPPPEPAAANDPRPSADDRSLAKDAAAQGFFHADNLVGVAAADALKATDERDENAAGSASGHQASPPASQPVGIFWQRASNQDGMKKQASNCNSCIDAIVKNNAELASACQQFSRLTLAHDQHTASSSNDGDQREQAQVSDEQRRVLREKIFKFTLEVSRLESEISAAAGMPNNDEMPKSIIVNGQPKSVKKEMIRGDGWCALRAAGANDPEAEIDNLIKHIQQPQRLPLVTNCIAMSIKNNFHAKIAGIEAQFKITEDNNANLIQANIQTYYQRCVDAPDVQRLEADNDFFSYLQQPEVQKAYLQGLSTTRYADFNLVRAWLSLSGKQAVLLVDYGLPDGRLVNYSPDNVNFDDPNVIWMLYQPNHNWSTAHYSRLHVNVPSSSAQARPIVEQSQQHKQPAPTSIVPATSGGSAWPTIAPLLTQEEIQINDQIELSLKTAEQESIDRSNVAAQPGNR